MASAEDKGKSPVDDAPSPAVPQESSEPSVAAEPPVPSKPPPPTNGGEVPADKHRGVAVDIAPELKGSGPAAPLVAKDYVDPNPVPFIDLTELKRWSFWRAAIAEFIATFLFLYITIQTIIGSYASGGGVGTLGIAFAFGVTIFVLVYCIAGISGGHINPAITFAFLLVRRISLPRALVYWIAQILGALAGVGLVKAYQKGFYQRYGGGANYVHYGYPKGAGLVAEIVGTFVLVYVVFTATDAKRQARDAHVPPLAPLAIGLAVFIVHLATIPITGTGINPARSFAPAAYWDHHDHAWHDHWIFWVGPLLGAALAATYQLYIIRAIPFHNLQLETLRYRV